MSTSSPDHAIPKTVCARCGSMVAEARGGSSCPVCMASDLAGSEWSDLLTPGGTEMLAGGGFTLMEEIGRGGMGIVYRAKQRAPEREVALKLLPPSYSSTSDGAQRLMAESAMMAEMDHPGILPLYASGVQDGRPWLAMKLASGGTLASRKKGWRGRWREAAELAAGLADAVQHAHERGLIHRDLKPGNILFDEFGRAYVADFGLAKWRDVDSGLTHTNMVLGTPAYMAPEVARADVRAATTSSDVYGLGAILYYLLCGQPPFPQAGTLEILRRIVDDDPAPPRSIVPDVPGDLQVICLKALARQPAGRYSGPDTMAADLRRWLAGESIEARPATHTEKIVRWVRRYPLSAGLSAGLFATIAASSVMLWQKNVELSGAYDTAVRSRNTAYEALGFATRDLPARLEERGRLGDLDGFYAAVETQLKALAKAGGFTDSVDTARRAELYVHWSRVLGWKGQMAECRKQMEQAVQLMESVPPKPEPPAEVWQVRSAAHRLLGKYLVEDYEDYLAGNAELEKARAAVRDGRARFPDSIALRVEEADVAGEIADSQLRQENWPAATEAARKAQELWTALRPALRGPDVPPFLVQREREKGSYPIYMLAVAAQETAGAERAGEYFRAYLKECEDQVGALDSGERKAELLVAINRVGAAMLLQESFSVEKVRKLFEQADKLGEELLRLDPENERWRSHAASNALGMAHVCKEEELNDEHIGWLNKCLIRLEPVQHSGRVRILEARLEALKKLAEASGDLPDAAAKWEECLKAGREAAAFIPARWQLHNDYMNALQEAWEFYGRQKATPDCPAPDMEALARRWIADAQVAAVPPDASPFWAAAQSGAYRRLAGLLAKDPARQEEARAANRAALSLRAGVFRLGPRCARDMLNPMASPCTALLNIAPVSREDALLVLSTLTDLAGPALACTKKRGWRDKWEEAALRALKALPDPERYDFADRLRDALYPPPRNAVAGKLDIFFPARNLRRSLNE